MMGWRNALLNTLMIYEYDNTIFDGFRVPGEMSKENTVNNILLHTSDFSVIYSDPFSLKNMIKLWTDKNFSVWEELEKTLHYDYNPIHNYDRTEEGQDILDGKNVESRDLTNTDNYVRNLQDAGNVKNRVSAFNNADGMADSNASDSTVNYTGNSTDTKKDAGTVTDKRDDTNKHYLRAYGNIGVTTTQDMIQAQRDIVEFNMIDYIIDDYKKHFCILVY